MINKGDTYLVMGLLDSSSIAFYIGKTIESMGGKVIYSLQSERLKKIFFDRSKDITKEERDALDIRYCDVTIDKEVKELFDGIDKIAGVVHSIAFANPKTCLGEKYYTEEYNDILQSFHISCVSLATVVNYAQPKMKKGGSILTLTFDTKHVYPYYNWMGVNKAALEANVRALARTYGKFDIRINAVSAGPLGTKAASRIPGYGGMSEIWNKSSPLHWNVLEDKQEVANASVFLLGKYSGKITGQILFVDGGASIVAGTLMDFEKNDSSG